MAKILRENSQNIRAYMSQFQHSSRNAKKS